MTSVVATGRRMKRLGEVHWLPAPRAGPVADAFTCASLAPGESRNWPSVTTVSPGGQAAGDDRQIVVGARSTVTGRELDAWSRAS